MRISDWSSDVCSSDLMLLVAAAGNEGPHAAPVFPAGYPSVLAVTAVDASLQPYRHANRGDYIDLAAPGVDFWSARSSEGRRVGKECVSTCRSRGSPYT